MNYLEDSSNSKDCFSRKKSPYHCISEKIPNKTQNKFLLGMRKEMAVNIIFLEVNQNLYFSQSDIKYVDLLVCVK